MTTEKNTNKKNNSALRPRKRPLKRQISTDLIPIEEETWLIQPIAVTMMRHDYSLIQIRILVSIVENLQQILHGILNNQRARQLELFTTDELDEDGRMPIRLPFKALKVDANHYPQLRTSLKMLASIPVEIPYKSPEGKKFKKITNLCDVYIPEDNSYNKYAVLKIDKSVAERLVSLELGYHRLGKQIVFNCRNRYTQRIYMFIESWVEKGRAVIKTDEFRKMLRLEDSYHKFSDVVRRVLQPAADELRELAEQGFSDCWFDYEKKYDHGQRGGEPDELVFRIHRTENGIDKQLEQISQAQRERIAQMLVRHFDFTPANARKLSERVNGDNYSDVFTKLTDLYSRLRTDYSIRDKAAYVFASLDRLFKEHEVQEPEEVK
ncbi:MAG: replication initiation protein [Prevotella sp.]|nr:replication initiation protein [Prevotella sp.]